jgi:cellulose biosynthesis protein BcsQ
LSRTYDALQRAERLREGRRVSEGVAPPYRVVTVTSNKGGVGKTTFALNLAVYVRAMREDLPILVIGLDEQDTVERMLGFGEDPPHANVVSGLRRGTLESSVRLGQYGIHYVPSSRQVSLLKSEVRTLWHLDETLRRTAFSGLIILDTKSDLEILTQNAVAASDLAVVVVKDLVSLREADHLYALTDTWGRPRERNQVLLSLVDLRVKYAEGERDILALLLASLRERGYPHFPTFISLSRAIEALYTNPARSRSSTEPPGRGCIVRCTRSPAMFLRSSTGSDPRRAGRRSRLPRRWTPRSRRRRCPGSPWTKPRCGPPTGAGSPCARWSTAFACERSRPASVLSS